MDKRTHIKNNEFAFALIGVVFLAVLIFVGTAVRSFEIDMQEIIPNSIISSTRIKPALIEFDFGNGIIRTFEGPHAHTIFPLIDALMSISQSASLPILIAEGKIKTVGEIGNHGMWYILLNNQVESKPLELLTITAGDHYILQFQNTR